MPDFLLLVLQAMGMAFMLIPPIALLPAALFAIFYRRSGRHLQWFTALLWLLYAAYESMLRWGGWCSGECNIRVDLLLIYPILLVLSAAAVVQFMRRKRRPPPQES